MKRARYASDLTGCEWAKLEPLLPHPKEGGRPQEHSYRELVNASCYIDRAGCAWRMLPHDLPNWQTVYHYFRLWRLNGTWERIQNTPSGEGAYESRARREAERCYFRFPVSENKRKRGLRGY